MHCSLNRLYEYSVIRLPSWSLKSNFDPQNSRFWGLPETLRAIFEGSKGVQTVTQIFNLVQPVCNPFGASRLPSVQWPQKWPFFDINFFPWPREWPQGWTLKNLIFWFLGIQHLSRAPPPPLTHSDPRHWVLCLFNTISSKQKLQQPWSNLILVLFGKGRGTKLTNPCNNFVRVAILTNPCNN